MPCRLSVIRVCVVNGLLLMSGLSSYKRLRRGVWLRFLTIGESK